MKSNDLLTGESFIPRRITQKFARAENRIKFHNQKANKLRHSVMFVNTPLQKNLRILNEIMLGKSKGVFHKQYLLGKGYSFDVLTHYENFEEKRTACIYHFTIQVGENDQLIFNRIKSIKQ
jgi:hypothetical protein